MPSAQPHRGRVTRTEFDRYARTIHKADRDTAYAWIQNAEAHGRWFPSAAHAVHVWTVRRMARQSRQKSAPPP